MNKCYINILKLTIILRQRRIVFGGKKCKIDNSLDRVRRLRVKSLCFDSNTGEYVNINE